MHVSKGMVTAAIAALTAPLPLQAAGSRLLRGVSLRTITVLVVAAAVLATGGFAYVTYTAGQHRASTTRFVEREIVAEGLYEDIRSAAAVEGATTAAYFVVRLPELLADFDRLRADAESAFSQLREAALESDPEELENIERLEATHDLVARRYAEFLQALEGGNEEAALAIVADQDVLSQARTFNEEVELAADDAAARLLAAQHEDVAVQTRGSRIVLAGGVAWVFIISAVSFIQFRWVLRPIARVTAATRAMAAGDWGVRVPTAGLKELDDLSASFNMMAAQLQESAERQRQAATTDVLTGLPNYRSLQDTLTRELERSLRYGHSLAVLMMDIDEFKLFNDTHGHQAGDRVLMQVADVLRKTSRASDIIGRYGGDEFMVILPETDRDGAASVANRMLEVFSLERVHTEHGEDLPLALNVGLAVCPTDSQYKQELLACAAASLYEAKTVHWHAVRAFPEHGSNEGETSGIDRSEY